MNSYREWINKAEDDLRIAKLLYENNETPWAILFHAEQSIEKMLKAF